MYIIIERKEDTFKIIKFGLLDFKAVTKFLGSRHRKGRVIEEEETRIIYYETSDELNEIANEYNV